jgi:hypothetical protein
MRTRRWQVRWHPCPQPDGWTRLRQAVQLVIDRADAGRRARGHDGDPGGAWRAAPETTCRRHDGG